MKFSKVCNSRADLYFQVLIPYSGSETDTEWGWFLYIFGYLVPLILGNTFRKIPRRKFTSVQSALYNLIPQANGIFFPHYSPFPFFYPTSSSCLLISLLSNPFFHNCVPPIWFLRIFLSLPPSLIVFSHTRTLSISYS